jgi:hypothetical protein
MEDVLNLEYPSLITAGYGVSLIDFETLTAWAGQG